MVGEQRLEALSRLVGGAASSCKVLLEDLGIPNWVKVGMSLGLLGSQTFLFRC